MCVYNTFQIASLQVHIVCPYFHSGISLLYNSSVEKTGITKNKF